MDQQLSMLQRTRSEYIVRSQFGSLPKKVIITFSVIFMLFVIVTAIIYASVESWSYVDALYFSIITMSTVGYGDIVPQTPSGKFINIIFAYASFFGIFILFRVIVGYLVDHQIESIIRRVKIKKMRQSHRRYRELTSSTSSTPLASLSITNLAKDAAREIKQEEYDALNHGRNLQWVVHLVMYLLWLLLWTLFYYMSRQEDFTVFRALYFGIITSTTIGYGNHAPVTDQGKIFCFITLLFGTISLAILAGSVSQAIVSIIREKYNKMTNEKESREREESVHQLQPCDVDNHSPLQLGKTNSL